MADDDEQDADPAGDDAHPAPHDLRSYGRRRGRKLSDRQALLIAGLLPKVRLDLSIVAAAGPAAGFATPPREVWLEIGFGGGEHLVWHAERNPDVGLIGCEPFEEGVVKVLTAIAEQDLANIRVWPDDARDVLRSLPAASIARVFVLFPDPWPKKRHLKRRLLSVAALGLIARALQPGGELRVATDIPDYARTIFMSLAEVPALRWTATCPDDWRRRPPEWPETRYEQKALREGRHCVYLRFVRIGQ